MNLGIMKLTNSLTYEGKLKCNNKKVLEAKLELIDQNKEWDKEVECELINSNNTLIKLPNEHSVCSKKCLISRVFDSNQSVIFLNTDQFLNCQESKKKKSIINKVEIKIIIILLLELKKQNFNFNNLALLSIYKAQLAAISSQLLSRNLEIKNLFTIDKVQGLEFDLILFSAVRNNDTEELGFLLKDWRRINVALTRAKKKLIIIGSKRTLKGDKKLKEFLEFCKLEGALIG
ncbi:hypothetical protein K502DRAFT_311147 [Neoconidiobolus thromboides FSU 785]|nr:hypothetical protein K502DRAFT_311147 [Neoconidiobolus thromboides FSU 785]